MPCTVAIIGRPNVGKSTLFNRLTGRRLALVDKTPGLTRDRREGEMQLGQRVIRLIDTAGLEEAEEGSIAARMRAQTEAAIAEADLLLFLIDARTGLTPMDEAFADLVRASGRPVQVIAHKSERRAGEAGYFEAFALGLGEPLAVSAEHGDGMGALYGLIEEACARAERARTASEEEREKTGAPPSRDDGADGSGARPLRIAIVGRPNVGKSTLVNALLGEERMITGPEAGLTRDSIAVDLDWGGERLRLYDTAGLRRRARVKERPEHLSVTDALRAIRFAEVVILLLDAAHPFEKQDLHIADLVAREGRALVIAVNKWDAVRGKAGRRRALEEEADRLLPQLRGVPVVPVSALQRTGLDVLMGAVKRVAEIWNRRISTGALNRWLADAVARHTPPAVKGRRIRLRYMTQANARPPTFIVFCSRPDALPESYRRYLVTGLREAFDLPAVPIRIHLRKGRNPYA